MKAIPRDKLMHLGMGFGLALFFGLMHPLLGLISTVAAGGIKEDRDASDPERHTSDGWDAYATVCGAVPALAIVETLRVLGVLAGFPR